MSNYYPNVCVPSWEPVCTIFMMVFGMTLPGLEPRTYPETPWAVHMLTTNHPNIRYRYNKTVWVCLFQDTGSDHHPLLRLTRISLAFASKINSINFWSMETSYIPHNHTSIVYYFESTSEQWNPSCEVILFALEKWHSKRGGLSLRVGINSFMFRSFTLPSDLSRGVGLFTGWPLKRGSTE